MQAQRGLINHPGDKEVFLTEYPGRHGQQLPVVRQLLVVTDLTSKVMKMEPQHRPLSTTRKITSQIRSSSIMGNSSQLLDSSQLSPILTFKVTKAELLFCSFFAIFLKIDQKCVF